MIESNVESAAGALLAAILAGIAIIHFYWASGGDRGLSAAVPSLPSQPDRALFNPGRVGAAGVGLLLLLGAGVAMGFLLPAFKAVLLTGMAIIFAIRAVGEFRYVGFFKRVKGTRFAYWDTRLFSPLCVALSILGAVGSGLLGSSTR